MSKTTPATYLHCSMYGSYFIDCEVIERDVKFSTKEHGSDFEQLWFAACDEPSKKEGLTGHVIKYLDPFTDDYEVEWVYADRVTFDG